MTAKSRRGPRPAKPGRPAENDVAAMIRVDHAGEYGALRIYAGQLAVLGPDKRLAQEVSAIQRMAQQERAHFAAFDDLLRARAVRPTLLQPLWHVAGYALGATTALMGPEAAMACTAAVEEVIEAHYAAQVDRLSESEADLKTLIGESRADELAHREEALAQGAEGAAGFGALSAAIKFGCRVAIRLTERL